MLAAGLAPAIPSIHAPEAAYAEGAANSTVTITHQPVGGTFAKGAPLRLYVQAFSPDNHLLTYQWYRSDALAGEGTPIDGQTSSTLNVTTPSVSGTAYYYAEITDASSGLKVRSNAAAVSVQDWTVYDEDQTTAENPAPTSTAGSRPFWLELQNGGFECTVGATVHGSIYFENLPGWHTTITSMDSNYQGKRIIEAANASETYKVPNLAGSSLVAELASTDVSCLFQEVATQPGKIYSWKLDHHGRAGGAAGNDVMAVVIGPALTQEETESLATSGVIKGGSDSVTYPYGTNASRTEEKSLFNAIVNALKAQEGGTLPSSGEYVVPYVLPSGATRNYYVSMTSDPRVANASWGHYAGTYTVPEGQGSTVFAFANISSGSNGYGNLLDNVEFKAGGGVDVSTDVGYEGDGRLQVNDVQRGYDYGILEVRGSTAFAAQGVQAALGAASLTADENGWYAPGDTGTLTFSNLTPGKTYRVVAVPTNAINEDLGSNLAPGLVLDESYYRQVTIKPVADSSDGAGGNIQATAEATPDGNARVIVRPVREDVEYALLDTTSSGTEPDANAVVKGWTKVGADDEQLSFDGLRREHLYAIVARPKDYDEIDYADQVAAGSYVIVKTPSKDFVDVDEGSVTRSEDGMSLTVTNKSNRQQRYLVYDADTGEKYDGAWHQIQGGSTDNTSWTALDPTKNYQIVAAEPPTDVSTGSAPSPGLRSYGVAPAPEVDYVSETVGKDGVVPASIEYRVQDKADPGRWHFGSADSWVAGTGGAALSFAGVLDSAANGATLTYRLKSDYDGPSIAVVSAFEVPARPAAPVAGGGFAVDYAAETLSAGTSGAALQTRASGSSAWSAAGTAAVPFTSLGWGGAERAVEVRLAASQEGRTFASKAAGVTLAARPDVPTGLLLVENDSGSFVIKGLNTALEYAVKAGADGSFGPWTKAVSDGELDLGSPVDAVRVRVSATESAPVSLPATVTPSAYAVSLAAAATDLTYGYSAADAASAIALTVANDSDVADGANSAIVTDTVSLADDVPFTISHEGTTGQKSVELAHDIGKGSSHTDIYLVPNAGLAAGSYQVEATLVYHAKAVEGVSYTARVTASLTVSKAAQDVPTDLAATQQTADSLTLTADAPASGTTSGIVEFSCTAGSTWGASASVQGGAAAATLDRLNAGAVYSCTARMAGDDNHEPSPACPASPIATAHAAPAAADVAVDHHAETLSFGSAFEACTNDSDPAGSAYRSGDSLRSVLDAGGGTVSVRKKQTVDASGVPIPASAWYGVGVSRPSISLGTSSTNATSSRVADGTLSVTGAAQFQYRVKGAPDWTPVPGSKMEGLPAAVYEVRTPATSTAFASTPVERTIEANNFWVTFDLGYAAGTAPAEQLVARGNVASEPADPVREGYQFVDWYADGSIWDFGVAPTADTTLTAAWTANSYTVKFDANGGAGEPMADQPFVYDAAQALSACSYTREGYLFKGWSLVQGGAAEDPGAEPTVAYTDGQTVSNLASDANGTVTLFAVWARPAISAAVPINATVVVDASGDFVCPSPLDPANPDAGGYAISSTTPAALKVESVSFKLAEGATDVFTKAAKTKAVVNGLELAANDTDKTTAPFATSFTLAAARDGKTTYRPLELSLTYPGGTMTYAKEARPFATLTYKLAFDDGAAASGEGA